jgi:hypothetical protein
MENALKFFRFGSTMTSAMSPDLPRFHFNRHGLEIAKAISRACIMVRAVSEGFPKIQEHAVASSLNLRKAVHVHAAVGFDAPPSTLRSFLFIYSGP